MKVYISAYIEEIAGVLSWIKADNNFENFTKKMTNEVKAVCEGAFEAGVTEIYVKNAHDNPRNIYINKLPEHIKLQRGWSEEPMCMVSGLDSSFDAVLFIGYHSRECSVESPLAHTIATDIEYIKINGVYASEFLINAYAAAMYGVPVVFVSGDNGLEKEVKELNSHITTFTVKQGLLGGAINLHHQKELKDTKNIIIAKLKTEYNSCKIRLPEKFEVEIAYKKQEKAYQNSFYPGVKLKESKVIVYSTNDYYEVLRLLHFIG